MNFREFIKAHPELKQLTVEEQMFEFENHQECVLLSMED